MTQESAQHGNPIAIKLTADLVSAYVSNNSVPASELTNLITAIHTSIGGLATGTIAASEEPIERPSNAQIRKSITHDGIISFLDGKAYKTLRRHLTTNGMTPESYRAKFGLPHDYPMTAASYSEARSKLARELGLGLVRSRGKGAAADQEAKAATQETVAEAPKRGRGGRRKLAEAA